MISLEAARSRVLGGLPAIEPVELPVGELLGCVLAADIVATEPIPPFDNTSVDGYALRSSDVASVPAVLHVVDEIRAGDWPRRAIGSGEAARIMTGAPIPSGADAVVMVEVTEALGPDVRVLETVPPGAAIRPAGDDVEPGALVLRSGTVLGAAHLGLLAELGCSTALAYRRLRVGVISTGDELVADGSPLGPGQIRESNLTLLTALLRGANCEVVAYGVVPDEEPRLREVLERGAAECDALVTSGGVSMGDYDLVKVVLDQLGTMDWMQINIRPAKPFAFGVVPGSDRAVPVFGLPGNPVSSLVSFELLARPALLRMMGHSVLDRPTVLAVADERLRRNPSDERVNFVRVLARLGEDGRVHVRPSGSQGSHQLAATAGANGFARIEDGPGVDVGGEVRVLLIGTTPGAL